MKKITGLALFCLLFIAAACTTPQPPADNNPAEAGEMTEANTLTDQEIADGWRLLFDGVSSKGWRGYNKESFPEVGWTISNGELIVAKTGTEEAGLGGDIITDELFGDFELSLEFALADTSNSGIFYFIKEEEGVPIYLNAPEYQLLDDPRYVERDGAEALKKHLTGDNYDMEVSASNPLKPLGEWNHARIVVNYPKVEHWLNGVRTVAYEVGSDLWNQQYAESKFSGYPEYARTHPAPIGLQDHGHEIRFRNIKIKTVE